MKFIHIADLHLGMSPMGQDEECLYEALSYIVDECNKNEIDILLVAGDLFHSSPSISQLMDVDYRLGQLHSTKVVMVAGNHDSLNESDEFSSYKWNSEVTLLKGNPENGKLDKFEWEEMNLTVFGWSFLDKCSKKSYEKPLYKGISKVDKEIKRRFNILLAHGGDDKNIPINYKELSEKGYDYVALGHIHKPQIICDNMAYSGSLVPLDRTETGVHGYIYGEITKEGLVFWQKEYKKTEYAVIEVISDITSVQTSIEEQIIQCVQDAEENRIYSIKVVGKRARYIEFDFSKNVLAKINSRCNKLIVCVEDLTSVVYDYDKLTKESQVVREYIEKLQLCNGDDDVKKYALEYGVEAILLGMEMELDENY